MRIIWIKKTGPAFANGHSALPPFLRRPVRQSDYLHFLQGKAPLLPIVIEPPLWRLTSVELAGLVAMVGTVCLCVGYLAGCLRMVGPW